MSGLTAENSAIKVTPEIEEHLRTLNSADEIKKYMSSMAETQGLVRSDLYDPNVKIPVAPGSAPLAYAKILTINGQKFTLEAPTEAELLHKENELLRQTFEGKTPTGDAPARDEATGRFVTAKTPAEQGAEDERKAGLLLQFQMGQISATQYIEESGAVGEYLEKQGVPLEDLKTALLERQDAKAVASWQSATDEFLNSPEGADWPGGPNLKVIGKLLADNGLEDSPSAETLAACWKHMKENGLALSNPEVETQQRISEATSVEEIRNAARGGSSSLFGGR